MPTQSTPSCAYDCAYDSLHYVLLFPLTPEAMEILLPWYITLIALSENSELLAPMWQTLTSVMDMYSRVDLSGTADAHPGEFGRRIRLPSFYE